MRLAGDPDSCAALGRELERAVTQVAEGGGYPERSCLPADLWTGLAASNWQRMTTRRAARADRLAERLAPAGRALRAFADQLAELQLRGARLASVAGAEGLVMDVDGAIAPVPVPYGPLADPAAVTEQQRALHRAEVRAGLLAQVAALRADEEELHGRLVRELRGIGALGSVALRPAPVPQERTADEDEDEDEDEDRWWEPDWWDATGVLGAFKTTPLKDLSLSGLPPAAQGWAMLRTVPGMALVGGSFGVLGDLHDGYSLKGALLKETVVGASAVGAGAAAAAAATTLLAPAAAPVVAAVVVGAAVGYGLDKAWDAVADPKSDKTADRAPRPRPRPEVGPALPPRAVPLDPTCGQGPVLSQAS